MSSHFSRYVAAAAVAALSLTVPATAHAFSYEIPADAATGTPAAKAYINEADVVATITRTTARFSDITVAVPRDSVCTANLVSGLKTAVAAASFIGDYEKNIADARVFLDAFAAATTAEAKGTLALAEQRRTEAVKEKYGFSEELRIGQGRPLYVDPDSQAPAVGEPPASADDLVLRPFGNISYPAFGGVSVKIEGDAVTWKNVPTAEAEGHILNVYCVSPTVTQRDFFSKSEDEQARITRGLSAEEISALFFPTTYKGVVLGVPTGISATVESYKVPSSDAPATGAVGTDSLQGDSLSSLFGSSS